METRLTLHEWKKPEPYYIGIFLVGAYQEILGDMHNLFGDTHSINVTLDKDGNYRLSDSLQGDTVDSVLRYVHINADDLLTSYREKIGAATDLSAAQRTQYLDVLAQGLRGYTYLED